MAGQKGSITVTSEAPQPGAAGGDKPLRAAPSRFHWLRSVTLPGAWGAVVFASLSFTPSLLPRGGVLQGLLSGITAAIGYGLGVLIAWVWRAFADRGPRDPQPASWRAFYTFGGALLVVSFGLGQYWQGQIRDLMGVTGYSIPAAIASPFIALLMFGALLQLGRGLRWLYRALSRLLGRWIGQQAARALGWFAVVTLTYLVVSGILLSGLASAANQMFSVRNGDTPEGVQQPTTSLRSGGTGSLIPWDTLGRQGRKFVGLGPTSEQISSLMQQPAEEPIRVYAGLESAGSAEARAALAVDDLERAGGFDRKYLLVATTTGSGWVDPALADSLEYLTDGDCATVSMQYSYLPSWISYLVDQSKAREAGRSLFDAVYDHWSKLPPEERPALLVAGESLGSFGGETAFSGEYDLANRTAGALFTGPPNFNTLFREFEDHRDAGSLEVGPIYKDGRTVRFAQDASVEIPPTDRPWPGTRVLYLMHTSDPIVWWSPRLILHRPDWISEQSGTDVLSSMIYIPFVTFWQVTADLPFATSTPGGHGHKYTTEYVDGWNAVLRTSATPDQLDQVKAAVEASVSD